MAFMSMVFASLFVGFILIGWLFLLIGIILNIIRHVKKRKGMKNPVYSGSVPECLPYGDSFRE